jgi:hypothetical protein
MKLDASIIESWSTTYDDLQFSTKEFYKGLSSAIKERELPGISTCTVFLNEGGWFSRQREYLVIQRKKMQFIVCAAPYGKAYFFSWYLRENDALGDFLLQIPYVGNWLYRLCMPRPTFYRRDTLMMFKSSIRHVVSDAIAQIEHSKGVRPIKFNAIEPIAAYGALAQ